LAKWDITDDSIVSNPLKLIGSPTRKVSPELAKQEHDILQTLIDESFSDFKDIVKSGRPEFKKNPADLDKIATGQVFTAKQALANHLVDKLGYIDDAIAQAIALNGLTADDVRVVKYYAPKGLLSDVLMGPSASSDLSALGKGRLDLSALLDLTAPRAYYLCTWLPAVVRHGGL
jgi:protease-4